MLPPNVTYSPTTPPRSGLTLRTFDAGVLEGRYIDMDELTGKYSRLEGAVVDIGAAARGTLRLLDSMEEEWCRDERYYAFLALARHICDLTDEALDAADALGDELRRLELEPDGQGSAAGA